jgi:hypothetical protein
MCLVYLMYLRDSWTHGLMPLKPLMHVRADPGRCSSGRDDVDRQYDHQVPSATMIRFPAKCHPAESKLPRSIAVSQYRSIADRFAFPRSRPLREMTLTYQ